MTTYPKSSMTMNITWHPQQSLGKITLNVHQLNPQSSSMSSHTSYETTPCGVGYPASSGNIGQQSLYSQLDYRGYSENPTTLGQPGYDATPGSPVHPSTPNQRYNHNRPGSPGIPPAPTSLSFRSHQVVQDIPQYPISGITMIWR